MKITFAQEKTKKKDNAEMHHSEKKIMIANHFQFVTFTVGLTSDTVADLFGILTK